MNTQGFSYIEIMVALLVLGICAVPAADAIRNGATAAQVAAAKAKELRCMKSHMEWVLAEPYQNLAAAATEDGSHSPAYSRAEDASCIARYVFIARYERKYQTAEKLLTTANSTALERDNAMLRITVAPTSPTETDPAVAAATSGRTYSFTTLVIR
jgi:prepilin-type N-terminal cleavage/methylation domain-containing protein